MEERAMPQSPFRLTVLLAPILATMFVYPHLISATTRTVTDFGDTGAPGQLRTLINAATPGDTIVIPPGTITLTGPAGEHANASGDLDITKNLAIQGAGAGATIIDGGGIDKVFHILSGATVAISDLTISGRIAPVEFLTRGGGVFNENGTLTFTNCTIFNNSVGGGSGGGVYNNESGTLTPSRTARSRAIPRAPGAASTISAGSPSRTAPCRATQQSSMGVGSRTSVAT
jgi:hypothetical protein